MPAASGAIVQHFLGCGHDWNQKQSSYLAAKHGVIGLTREAALDCAAQNLRVNVVCPGYIDTPTMARFSGGTAEGRTRVISEGPSDGLGGPKKSPMQSSGCVQMRLALSSAAPCS